MGFLGLFVSLFLNIAGLNIAGADCVPDKDVQEVLKVLTLPEDFDRSELCDSKSRSWQLMSTLVFMKNNRFPNASVSPIYNRDILPENFWAFFTKRVQTIRFLNSGLCANVIATTIPAMESNIMYVCPEFYRYNRLLVERVSFLLHEARHLELDMSDTRNTSAHNHVKCTRGPAIGRKACDDSMDMLGAYATGIEALAKMRVSPALDAQNRAFAEHLILLFSEHALNETPRPQGNPTAIYLLSEDGHGYVFDGRLHEVAAYDNAQVIGRYYSLVVFPHDGREAFNAAVYSSIPLALPSDSSRAEDFNLLPAAQRPEVLDILIHTDYQAYVTTTQIEILDVPTFSLPWRIKKVYTAEEVGIEEKSMFVVITEQDQVFQVRWPHQKVELTDVTEPSAWLLHMSAIVISHGQRLALNKNGQVLFFTKDGWLSEPAMHGLKFKKMSREFLWESQFANSTFF